MNGFELLGIVGANRSPNCGIETTLDRGHEINGKGLFMEELSRRLEEEHIHIAMVGVKASDDVGKKIQLLL